MGTTELFELRVVAVNTRPVALGEDIRKARELLHMTQLELATAVGVSESTVSNWERGKVKAPKNSLSRLRDILNMDVPVTDDADTATTDEEEFLRSIDDGPLWAELTRRFFRNTTTGTTGFPTGHQRGRATPLDAVPEHLLPPQSDERRDSDG